MALFDKPEFHNLSEDYPNGAPFTIHWATYDGVQATQFGMSEQATLGITSPEGIEEEAISYRVFGNLAAQVKGMDADAELPLNAMIGKVGKANVFLPVD